MYRSIVQSALKHQSPLSVSRASRTLAIPNYLHKCQLVRINAWSGFRLEESGSRQMPRRQLRRYVGVVLLGLSESVEDAGGVSGI
jgi:hypothetical protein